MADGLIAKLGRGLVKTSAEEISKLSGTYVPSSPVEAEALGAPKKSVDMMGSPANVRNAIKTNLEGAETLAETERKGRVAEGPADAREETAGAVSAASSLFGRVGAAVEAQIKQQGADTGLAVTVDQDALDGILKGLSDPTQVRNVESLVEAVVKAPLGDKSLLSNVAKLMEAGVPPEQLSTLFGVNQEEWTKRLVTNIPNDIKMKDIPALPGMPADGDKEKLAKALGMDMPSLGNLTWNEVKDKVKAKKREEFADVDELRGVASDPLAPPTVRAEAQRRLRELGATGAYAAASDTERLVEALDKADDIYIGGQRFSMEEILDDDATADLISANLENPDALANTPFAALIPIIKGHRSALRERLVETGSAVKTIAANKEALSGFRSIGNVGMPDDLLRILQPDLFSADVVRGERLPDDTKASPLYASLRSIASNNPALASEYAALATSYTSNPLVMNWLKNKSVTDLQSLGDIGGLKTRLNSGLQVWDAAKRFDGDDVFANFDGTMAAILPKLRGYSPDELRQAFPNGLPSLLDSNKDFVIDEKLDDKLLAALGGDTPDIEAMARGYNPFSGIDWTGLEKGAGDARIFNTKAASNDKIWNDEAKPRVQKMLDTYTPDFVNDKILNFFKTTTIMPGGRINKTAFKEKVITPLDGVISELRKEYDSLQEKLNVPSRVRGDIGTHMRDILAKIAFLEKRKTEAEDSINKNVFPDFMSTEERKAFNETLTTTEEEDRKAQEEIDRKKKEREAEEAGKPKSTPPVGYEWKKIMGAWAPVPVPKPTQLPPTGKEWKFVSGKGWVLGDLPKVVGSGKKGGRW